MKFIKTHIPEAFIIDLELRDDPRGSFARTFCVKEFEAHGLKASIMQCNIASNFQKGTVRGMHYQLPPAGENKLIRCLRGAILDVLIDLRPASPTFLQSLSVHLSAENRRSLYVPEMCAHGYQTLTDDTEVLYQSTEYYSPGQERGVRHDDPLFKIAWPLPVSAKSDKDKSWPDFDASLVDTREH